METKGVPGSGAEGAAATPGAERRVPYRALVISVGALAVPLAATTLAPEAIDDQYAMLIWLPALVPAFLLTYHRGWGGASVALAGAMATLTLSQVVVSGLRARAPEWHFVLILVLVWVAVCLGVGWFGELLHRARREAEAMALRDPLTGLPNRTHLGVFLDYAFGAATRGASLTAVVFDLDSFKAVNDLHGHAAGDETLVAFAEVLRKHTRRSDISARFGGEEFVSVLTGTGGTAGAKVFADRVRITLRGVAFPWGTVTTSAGICSYRRDMTSPEQILAEADGALYRAKREGRDRTVIAETDAGARLPAPAPSPA